MLCGNRNSLPSTPQSCVTVVAATVEGRRSAQRTWRCSMMTRLALSAPASTSGSEIAQADRQREVPRRDEHEREERSLGRFRAQALRHFAARPHIPFGSILQQVARVGRPQRGDRERCRAVVAAHDPEGHQQQSAQAQQCPQHGVVRRTLLEVRVLRHAARAVVAQMVVAHRLHGRGDGIAGDELQQPQPRRVGAAAHVARVVQQHAQPVQPAGDDQRAERIEPRGSPPQYEPRDRDHEPIDHGVAQQPRNRGVDE